MRALPKEFFRRSADIVAPDLLGHLLVHRLRGENLVLRIVETEAYLGEGDRASHAWRGQPTGRTEVLFGPGGVAYVYLVYGLHNMFNVATGERGEPGAVLVRAGEPVSGMTVMVKNRRISGEAGSGSVAGGPGKLCQAMAIDRRLNGVDLSRGELTICQGRPLSPKQIVSGRRIGVDYAGAAAAWPLRFAERGNRQVSRPHPW